MIRHNKWLSLYAITITLAFIYSKIETLKLYNCNDWLPFFQSKYCFYVFFYLSNHIYLITPFYIIILIYFLS